MVSRIDIDTDCALGTSRMQPSTERSQKFGEYYIGTAMEQPKGLGVSINWHSSHDALRRGFNNLDAHLLVKGSNASILNHL